MRYDAEHKQRTRERVIAEAAKAIRSEGPHGRRRRRRDGRGGPDARRLLCPLRVAATPCCWPAIERMFEEGRARILAETGQGGSPKAALTSYIDFYLSRSHRDARTAAVPCPSWRPRRRG